MTQNNDSAPATAPEVLELTEGLLNMHLNLCQAIFLPQPQLPLQPLFPHQSRVQRARRYPPPFKSSPSTLANNKMGPFYLVTCGRNPGVYSRWDCAGSEVTGVPTAIVRGVPSLSARIAHMNSAIAEGQAAKIAV
ncbi:hypothetical protein EV421DRAFT_1744229 [Armillaria borealis]|uniref:Ribonuclease H1 N-terminal domain-containing protein n=1 Tax=Armillaria borealis TaxID=47425 RepID=A0AA39IVE4_9AGAR|nr:hypothetical protein EV421DRAFT_1744229 [Armillaria borealis]